jgi:hypothetical protein
VWVRLKGERNRMSLVRYYIRKRIDYDYKTHSTLVTSFQLVGTLASGADAVLDEGTEDEMNARFDDMAAYQDASARYRSGWAWCYDMNKAVDAKEVKEDGVSQG